MTPTSDGAGSASGDAGDASSAPVEDGRDAPTWAELWQRTATEVGDRTHARWLCETAGGTTGAEFLAALDERPSTRVRRHLDAMVDRALSGEPLQYVLGHWGFRRLDLAVDRRALIPRPETEMLVELAVPELRARPSRRVVDLGTGTGAVGLALADELPVTGTEVWLTDASPEALDLARANLAGIGRAAANVRVAQGRWYDALPGGLRFDAIVSNPPYVAEGSPDIEPAVTRWEPHDALFAGADGLDHLRVLIAGAGGRLRRGGILVLEIGATQGGAVSDLLVRAGLVDVAVHPDPAGHDRVAFARMPS